jgi:hypothetical protein
MAQSSVGNVRAFQGREWEGAGCFVRSRFANPSDGSFLQPDMKGAWFDKGSTGNRSGFLGRNPLSLIDPLGFDAVASHSCPADKCCGNEVWEEKLRKNVIDACDIARSLRDWIARFNKQIDKNGLLSLTECADDPNAKLLIADMLSYTEKMESVLAATYDFCTGKEFHITCEDDGQDDWDALVRPRWEKGPNPKIGINKRKHNCISESSPDACVFLHEMVHLATDVGDDYDKFNTDGDNPSLPEPPSRVKYKTDPSFAQSYEALCRSRVHNIKSVIIGSSEDHGVSTGCRNAINRELFK